MESAKLPIGIQSFSEMRTKGYYYVDKTPFISSLVKSGKYYFLSRPRRFGKSLFIDTLDCAFSGRKELFSGLYLQKSDSGWDFTQTSPVLRVDLAGGTIRSPQDLTQRLHRIISRWEEVYSIRETRGSPGERLLYFIPQLAATVGSQIVILIDEYDKPILDNLENPSLAADLRDLLKDFYGAIKPLDEHLRFVFLTGVSKFAKTGIFSGLNNLNDISIDARYSAICGYTHEDLLTTFKERMSRHDINSVSRWYNGYSWLGERVFNPFDILLFLDQGVFRPYWFESGTPSFLIKIWKREPRPPAEYNNLKSGEEILGSFDPEHIRIETLLFQSGYLTIKEWSEDPVRGLYCTLGFPNNEVRTSLNILLSEALSGRNASPNRERLYTILEESDCTGLFDLFKSFFASIPHDWYRKNQISWFEGYYASVVYTYFASLGYDVIAEDTTNHGRIDLTVKTKAAVWIFEFEVIDLNQGRDKSPLSKLIERGYREKYAGSGLPIYEIGVGFDPKERNIVQWEVRES